MVQKKQIYKCEICGNIVEVLHGGAGELVCCGQAMKLLKENTSDAAEEKHIPIITENDTGIIVSIGSQAHPMEDKHHIEWIELIADNKVYRQHLNPGDEPSVTFPLKASRLKARAFCNLHGLWSA